MNALISADSPRSLMPQRAQAILNTDSCTKVILREYMVEGMNAGVEKAIREALSVIEGLGATVGAAQHAHVLGFDVAAQYVRIAVCVTVSDRFLLGSIYPSQIIVLLISRPV